MVAPMHLDRWWACAVGGVPLQSAAKSTIACSNNFVASHDKPRFIVPSGVELVCHLVSNRCVMVGLPCRTSPGWGCASPEDEREIECLLNDNHQKGKMMIMIMKTSGSQVDSPVAEGKRKEGGGRKIRDLHRDT